MAEKKSFLLRMNPELYEVMEKWAADELRSVNGHIEYLLRDAALRNGRLGRKGLQPVNKDLKKDQSGDI